MAKSKEELKSLWMKLKEESEKADLKLSIQKTKIMASSAITLWQIEGGEVEAVTSFTSWPPKSLWTVTAIANRLLREIFICMTILKAS